MALPRGDDPARSVLRDVEEMAAGSPLLESLTPLYYRHVPDDDIETRSPGDLLGAMVSHVDLGTERPAGTSCVRVHTPTDDTDGWSCGGPVAEIVTDDMPFIVDSVAAELTRLGRGMRLVIHPVLSVQRDVAGTLQSIASDGAGTRESWIHAEISRGAVPAPEIEAALRRVLSDVREAVEDWPRMRAKAVETADDLEEHPPVGIPVGESDESAALLRWIADDNFTFLGYREYDLVSDGYGDHLRAIPGTGLGILRSDPDLTKGTAYLSAPVAERAREPRVLVLTTANSRSTVHRPSYLDYIGVKRFDAEGNVVGERRFLGIYAASTYAQSVREIPVLRTRAEDVLAELDVEPQSHTGKDVMQFLETYPREELFQVDSDELAAVALAVHQMAERRQTRLFVRRDPYGRFMSCFVYLPRDRYNTAVRLRIQDILQEAYGGTSVDYTARVSESVLARLHVVVRAAPGATVRDADVVAVQEQIIDAVRSWDDDFSAELIERVGEDRAAEILATYAAGFPEAYKQEVPADAAVKDILIAETADGDEVRLRLYAPEGHDSRLRRIKIIRGGESISLSEVLPVLGSLGVIVEDEHPYDIARVGQVGLHVYDLGFQLPEGDIPELESLRERFEAAFLAIWHGRCEADALNGLAVRTSLTWEQIVILRAYVRYLQQTGSSLGQEFAEGALLGNRAIAQLIVELFEARFDPRREDGRRDRQETLAARARQALEAVASLDEDRILRSLLGLVSATMRTNAYRRDRAGQPLDRLSVKLDAPSIPELPLPRPRFEIWVYSPHVEGVHLRFGRIARGGLRWSDRRADFRTEILGLVKAQEVKNAVIVPVGAKGGFLPKALPDPSVDRDGWMAEGRAAYSTFIRGMLDVTDNLVDGVVVPPPDVVRHDGDDPYLVVAADKGTATFSDLANSVAEDYDFWLGDAFASGGSAGYDHKAMGITARGAWISVQRHFRDLGLDVQAEDFTVAGVGDMSGDVFGNGMLLSPHIRLVAAFDHRHIFLDPDPDPATSFAERERLFALPRSSWTDYDTSLISPGGGIHSRSAKSIPITPEVRARLDIPEGIDALTPAELIKRILTAPVDLLWNGGIGTYVKAQTETNADAGDKTNDPVRVNGNALRCRVIGEGGNLGLTQLGRVEASRHGVQLNTDAIDNSAGVDTSDHEVNIKILLDGAVREGALDESDRDALLTAMTDEVADLVLADNYEQNVLLGNARWGAPALVSVHARMITDLESRGMLNRAIEFLPDDEEITTRAAAHQGLTSPELAVLAAYAKIALTSDLEDAGLSADPWFAQYAVDYFPALLRERFADRIAAHPLRDEIITTVVVNGLINDGGISVVFRACEETGASPAEVVRAATAAIAIFDLPSFWNAVNALDNRVPTSVQDALHHESRRLLDRSIRWFLQTRGGTIDVSAEVARFAPTVAELAPRVPGALVGIERARLDAATAALVAQGSPADLAEQASAMLDVFGLLDIVQVAESVSQPPADIMPLYFALSERYDIDRLLSRITALPRGDRWTALARQALRTDLYAALAGVTAGVAAVTSPQDAPERRIEDWEDQHREGLGRAQATLDQIAALETGDLATLSVALRVLRNLVAQGQVQAPGVGG
ncbi:MAG: NAD-glutamate dehydrogenase [Candidatus Nanopelagicales bacterium]